MLISSAGDFRTKGSSGVLETLILCYLETFLFWSFQKATFGCLDFSPVLESSAGDFRTKGSSGVLETLYIQVLQEAFCRSFITVPRAQEDGVDKWQIQEFSKH